MCHYTTPFAAITVLIRPRVYPQTQTLEQKDTQMCACTHAQLQQLAALLYVDHT